MMYSVYFLKSSRNGKVYVGVTGKHPNVRLCEHNSGANIWTRQNRPFILLYYEQYLCKEDALRREKFYKTGTGRKVRNAILSCFG